MPSARVDAEHDREPHLPADYLAARLLPHLEGLDGIADLDVVERPEPDTALEPFADLGGVVLEPPQRLHREVAVDDDAVADQPGLGVAPDGAGTHDRTGDVAYPGNP